jgi:peroxiredoxin Q/BCP
MTLKLGSKIPSFTLVNQDGEKRSSKELLTEGQYLVLYFYPKAMTPGCTTQACGLRNEEKKLKKLKIKIVGISADSPERLKKFEEKENLNFELLSDMDNSLAIKLESFGQKKFMGKTYDGIYRQTYIYSSEGKLLHVMDDVKTKTHHQDLIQIIEQF